MRVKFYINRQPELREEIIGRAIYGLLKNEEWVAEASRVVAPPLAFVPPMLNEDARLAKRRTLPDGRVMLEISCSDLLFRLVGNWLEELTANDWHGGPVPPEMPDN